MTQSGSMMPTNQAVSGGRGGLRQTAADGAPNAYATVNAPCDQQGNSNHAPRHETQPARNVEPSAETSHKRIEFSMCLNGREFHPLRIADSLALHVPPRVHG